VSALTGTIGYGKVTLSWTDPADADFDHIEITWTPGDGAATVSKGTQTKEITGLTKTPLASTGVVSVVFNGLPQDETITLTGPENMLSWAADTMFTVSSGGTFTGYRWALDGAVLSGETGNSLTLYAGSLSVKQHRLTVFVTKDGSEYAKAVTFTVTP
jgi:hypothetical protein